MEISTGLAAMLDYPLEFLQARFWKIVWDSRGHAIKLQIKDMTDKAGCLMVPSSFMDIMGEFVVVQMR